MYKEVDLKWLPKPHTFYFVKSYLEKYRYTSCIILSFAKDKVVLAKVKARGWDFVGGRIEEGEDILECAQREYIEESGYPVGELIFYGSNAMDAENNPKGKHTAQAIYVMSFVDGEKGVLEEDIEESALYDVNNLPFNDWRNVLITNAYKEWLSHES